MTARAWTAGRDGGRGAWHLAVDQGQCIGSGMCVVLVPDRFSLPADARTARVLPGAAVTHPDDVLLDAADSCPVLAITVTERSTGRIVGPRP